jgi:hypothetical protein
MSRSSWLGSHNLTNFLPSLDMLPLSNQQEIINISPPILQEERKEEKIIKKNIEDLCATDPYLFPRPMPTEIKKN